MVVIVERTKPKSPALLEAYEARLAASANVEEQYRNFDVVWAKMAPFPWWPAVLFYSWDAVNEAGLDLKDTQKELVIPPPKLQALPDGKGERLVHSVLVMFLDRFNCLVLELSPKTVCPFALNYSKLRKPKQAKSGFNVALKRAEKLLHMSDHITEETLEELAPIRVLAPPPEPEELLTPPPPAKSHRLNAGGKRQKPSHQPKPVAELERIEYVEIDDEDGDAVDDEEEEEEEEAYVDDDESAAADSKKTRRAKGKAGGKVVKPIKKMSAKASQLTIDLAGSVPAGKKAPSKTRKKPGVFRVVEAIDDDEFEDDFEVQAPPRAAAEKKEAARKGKKASRKEGRVHQQQDVISVDDDDDDDIAECVVAMSKTPTSQKKKPMKSNKLPKKSAHGAAAAKGDVSKVKKTAAKKKKKKKKKNGHSESESEEEQDEFEYYEEEVFEELPEPKKKAKKKQKNSAKHAHENGDSYDKAEAKSEAESPAAEPLTLTPLSTIWTTRQTLADGKEPAVNAHHKTETEAAASLAYKLDLLWDDETFTETQSVSNPMIDGSAVEDLTAGVSTNDQAPAGSERASGRRQVRSVQQSQIRQSLMSGTLEPHTMVQCEAYLPKGAPQLSADVAGRGSRAAAPQLEAPFEVVVHPDAVFVCDLHAHLATCEIIGFLGGRWDDERKTLYIQAAFPCRSLVIEGDDGSTDVEMDPGSEIELREIIQNAELEVVGWYHSHPEFAPDPSVVDINNQSNYQQLFQRRTPIADGKFEIAEPFVGLIVGTYDTRRESPVALFRYFHTRSERVNSGMRREVNMPYELVPRQRHYRAVLESERLDPKRRTRWFVALAKMLLAKMRAGAAADAANADAMTKQRKRKGSTDITAQRESVTKKKRGRVSKADIAAQSIHDLTRSSEEVIDLMSENTSQEAPSQSSDQVSQQAASQVEDMEMVVCESSQSQTEPVEVVVEEGSVDEKKVLYRAMPPQHHEAPATKDPVKTVPQPNEPVDVQSEGIVGDSSASPDINSESPKAEETRKPVGRLSGKTEGDDDFVSASASSSASSSWSAGDASFLSYDASQSQSMSQSQSQSQNEEAAPLSPPTPQSDMVMEDDPYADIEVLPSESPFNQSTPSRRKEKQRPEEPEVVDLSTEQKSEEDSATPSKQPTKPPAKRTIQLSDSDDEIVKDSATDSSVAIQQDQQMPDRSPVEDDSGSNSAVSGGGSTPVDPSVALSNARRRTRKPSTTKRHTDTATLTSSSISPTSSRGTSVSPRLSVVNSIVVDSVVEDRATPAEAHVPRSDELTQVDAVWGDIDVIDVDKSETPQSLTTTEEPNPEEKDTMELKEDALSSTDSVKLESAPEVGEAVNSPYPDDKSKTFDVPTSSAEEKKAPIAHSDAKVEAAETKPSELEAETRQDSPVMDLETESPKIEAPVAPVAPMAPLTGALDVINNSVEPVSKPLEKLTVLELDDRAKQLGYLKKRPRRKADLIALLREHELRASQMATTSKSDVNTESDERVVAPETETAAVAAQPVQDEVSATTALLILDETEAVVLELVSAVETVVLAEASSAVAPAESTAPAAESTTTPAESTMAPVVVETVPTLVVRRSKMERLLQRREKHLQRLRTEYNEGIYGCAEQVITLIDYYRDFDRRTDMIGWWKPRITKAEKLEASLRADAQHVNIPVDQRDAFIRDVMGYLRTSWEICSVRR